MTVLQDDFVHTVQLLLDDEGLLQWFMALSRLSEQERTVEIRNLVVAMSSSNSLDEHVAKIAAMTDAKNYNTVRAVLLAELNQRN